MSNTYCNVSQLLDLFDQRSIAELTNDSGQGVRNDTRVQNLLDMKASELEATLANRWPLPLPTVPLVLRMWVGLSTVVRFYGRRADRPKGLDADAEWCKDFLRQLRDGEVNLPGVSRNDQPQLLDSESFTGRSRFSYVPYFDRGPTGTSADGKGLPVCAPFPPNGN